MQDTLAVSNYYGLLFLTPIMTHFITNIFLSKGFILSTVYHLKML